MSKLVVRSISISEDNYRLLQDLSREIQRENGFGRASVSSLVSDMVDSQKPTLRAELKRLTAKKAKAAAQ